MARDNDRYLKCRKRAEELLPLYSDVILSGKSKKILTKAHYKEVATALLTDKLYDAPKVGKPGAPLGPLKPRIKLYLTIYDEATLVKKRNPHRGVGTACANVFDRFDHGCKNIEALEAKYIRERKFLWKFFSDEANSPSGILGSIHEIMDPSAKPDTLIFWFES